MCPNSKRDAITPGVCVQTTPEGLQIQFGKEAMSCGRIDKSYTGRKALLIVTNLQAWLKCTCKNREAKDIHAMYSKGIPQAHGRHIHGISPGHYTVQDIAKPWKIHQTPDQAWTQNHSTRGMHHTSPRSA